MAELVFRERAIVGASLGFIARSMPPTAEAWNCGPLDVVHILAGPYLCHICSSGSLLRRESRRSSAGLLRTRA